MNRNTASLASAVFCFVACVLLIAFSVVPAPVVAAEVAAAVEPVADVSFVAWLLANVPDLIQAFGLIVTGASALAALTPTPKDDGVLLWLRKVIDFLALNVLGAKNGKSSKDIGSFR